MTTGRINQVLPEEQQHRSVAQLCNLFAGRKTLPSKTTKLKSYFASQLGIQHELPRCQRQILLAIIPNPCSVLRTETQAVALCRTPSVQTQTLFQRPPIRNRRREKHSVTCALERSAVANRYPDTHHHF